VVGIERYSTKPARQQGIGAVGHTRLCPDPIAERQSNPSWRTLRQERDRNDDQAYPECLINREKCWVDIEHSDTKPVKARLA